MQEEIRMQIMATNRNMSLDLNSLDIDRSQDFEHLIMIGMLVYLSGR